MGTNFHRICNVGRPLSIRIVAVDPLKVCREIEREPVLREVG